MISHFIYVNLKGSYIGNVAMRRKFHLLNSPKYFSISKDYGLFGVSERNLNQLANIWRGDIVFYYTAH